MGARTPAAGDLACSVTCTVIRGTVRHGFKRGRTLDSLTANLSQEVRGRHPCRRCLRWLGRVPGTLTEFLPAAISVGTQPPAHRGAHRRGTRLRPFDLNLYGERIAALSCQCPSDVLSIMSTACCARWTTTPAPTASVLGIPASPGASTRLPVTASQRLPDPCTRRGPALLTHADR